MQICYRSPKKTQQCRKRRKNYKLKACCVILHRVDLVELQRNYAEACAKAANESGRRSRQVVCYICLAKFANSAELHLHKKLHDDMEAVNMEQVIKPIKNANFVNLLQDASTGNRVTTPPIDRTHMNEGVNVNQGISTSQFDPDVEKSDVYLFKCITCNSYFKSGVNLFDHVRENKGRACKFYCEYCCKMFNYPIEFSQHISKHLAALVKSKKKEMRPLNSQTNLTALGKYKCYICTKVFEDCFQLKRHYILGHKLNESEINENNQLANQSVSSVNNKNTSLDFVAEVTNDDSGSTLTCNLCFDEFQTKGELKEHFDLHVQLECNKIKNKTKTNAQKEKEPEASASKSDDVIVIDDEDDNSNKKNDVRQQTVPLKLQRVNIPLGKLVSAPGTSVLRKHFIKGNPCPPLVLSNKNVRLLGPVSQVLNQAGQMILLSGVNVQKPSTSQDVKLLKTGPTSFQLCFDESSKKTGATADRPTVPTQKSMVNSSPVTVSNVLSTSGVPVFSLQQSTVSNKLVTTSSPMIGRSLVSSAITDNKINPAMSSNIPASTFSSKVLSGSATPVSTVKAVCLPKIVSVTTVPSPATTAITSASLPKDATVESCHNMPSLSASALTNPREGVEIGSNNTAESITENVTVPKISCVQSCATEDSATPIVETQTNIDEKNSDTPEHLVNICNSDSHKPPDDGNESDDMDNLVIDEEQCNESSPSVVPTNSSEPSVVEKPKIFVRKLSDLMDPEKLLKEKNKQKVQVPKNCEDCKVVFHKLRSFRLHIKKKHCCIKCDYKSCRLHAMKNHYVTKHNLFFCIRCKIVVENGYDLYKHNEELHKCPDCLHSMKSYELHKPKCPGTPTAKTAKNKQKNLNALGESGSVTDNNA